MIRTQTTNATSYTRIDSPVGPLQLVADAHGVRRIDFVNGRNPVEADPQVAAAIEGSIVFVGTSSAGLQDIRTTALGQNVPGVSMHAQTVEQILTGATPVLAPGSLSLIGLVGLAHTYRHPALHHAATIVREEVLP